MDTMDGSRSTSQQITSLLGTDDWVIVSLGDRLYTDSELDTIEAEREPVVVDDAMAERLEEAIEAHRYRMVGPASVPPTVECACGRRGSFALEWRRHRHRAALTAALTPDGQGEAHLRGRWSNGDPVHIITDGVERWIAPNHNGATWIPEGQ